MSNPWEIGGKIPWKTEAEFWGWVKGAIRKGWSRHPVRVEFKNARRFKAPFGKVTKKNPTGLVWCLKCEFCNETFRESFVEIDHKKSAEHSRWYDDISAFVKRMYLVCFEDLQALCKPCHGIKSYSDKMGISFELARVEKDIIAICKTTASQKKWLIENGIVPLGNTEQRKKQIREKMNV